MLLNLQLKPRLTLTGGSQRTEKRAWRQVVLFNKANDVFELEILKILILIVQSRRENSGVFI